MRGTRRGGARLCSKWVGWVSHMWVGLGAWHGGSSARTTLASTHEVRVWYTEVICTRVFRNVGRHNKRRGIRVAIYSRKLRRSQV